MIKGVYNKERDKLQDFVNAEVSSIQGSYTITDLEEEIRKIENSIKKYKVTEENNKDSLALVKLTQGPKECLRDYEGRLLRLSFASDWTTYKERIYNYWESKYNGRHFMRNPAHDNMVSALVYSILVMLWIASLFVIPSDVSFITRVIRTICVIFFIVEVTSAICSVYIYIVRPNIKYRRKLKNGIKEIHNNMNELNRQLKYKYELLEAKKASDLKASDIISRVKEKTNNTMQEEVNNAREKILPSLSDTYRSKFGVILDKSSELLKVCSTDTAALNEVSSIYNICITEVSGVLLRNGANKSVELDQLLDNFEAYLDRKIKKYEAIKNMSMQSDVNALNVLFESDK